MKGPFNLIDAVKEEKIEFQAQRGFGTLVFDFEYGESLYSGQLPSELH